MSKPSVRNTTDEKFERTPTGMAYLKLDVDDGLD